MRASLIVLALASCTQAPQTDNVDSPGYRQAEVSYYREKVQAGIPREKARAEILAARELMRKLEHDPQANWEQAQDQKDIAEMHRITCASQPYLPRC